MKKQGNFISRIFNINHKIYYLIHKLQIQFRSEASFIVRNLSFVSVFSYDIHGEKYYQYHVVFDDATDFKSDYYTDLDKCLNDGIQKLKTHPYPWGGFMNISSGKIKYRNNYETP